MKDIKILSLNCQKGYQTGLKEFLNKVLKDGQYDFLLLQEFTGVAMAAIPEGISYKILHGFNNELGKQSHLAILYRDNFLLKKSTLHSFSFMHPTPFLIHPGFGLLLGQFEKDGREIYIGSVHQHSGLRLGIRMRETKKLKEILRVSLPSAARIVFGGDFNLGLPGEVRRTNTILSPEFASVTKDIGPTLDSRYTENVPVLTNRIAVFLAKFGIRVPLKTDHLFVDRKTATESKINTRILPNKVSDHSPIELIIQEQQRKV
ncbi:MAG TPA: endonuclease/exonuclease/phosphatase family protein [Candidatus Paceibacterota bacterium]